MNQFSKPDAVIAIMIPETIITETTIAILSVADSIFFDLCFFSSFYLLFLFLSTSIKMLLPNPSP